MDGESMTASEPFEEEVVALEPAWLHLQIVYEFFLRFVASAKTSGKIAKRYVDHTFISRLLGLFDSEDPRERDYLKKILHGVYVKFRVHRNFIWNAINGELYLLILMKWKHNGIGELLSFVGGIIRRFVIPQEQCEMFLDIVLMPLHELNCLQLYHRHLCNCIKCFLQKDYELADMVIRGLLKFLLFCNSSKKVLFLGELEEVLEVTQEPEFQKYMVPLFREIAKCLSSRNLQVAERALVLLKNDHVVTMTLRNIKVLLPIILPALETNIQGNLKQVLRVLSEQVVKLLLGASQDICMACSLRLQVTAGSLKEMQEKLNLKMKKMNVESQRNPSSLPLCIESMNPFSFQWEHPPMGWLKVNFAGEVQVGDRASAGAVIRDSRGQVLCAVSLKLNTFSMLSSEFRGAWEGLKLACTLEGFDGVWLEGYSQRVITWIQKALYERRFIEHKPGLGDILHWITSFSDCRCSRIYREGNKPAHFLANLGTSTSKFFASEEAFLMELLQMVKRDREGQVYTVDDLRECCWVEWSGPSKFRLGGSGCCSNIPVYILCSINYEVVLSKGIPSFFFF